MAVLPQPRSGLVFARRICLKWRGGNNHPGSAKNRQNPKSEYRNPKQIRITKIQMTKTPRDEQYDLEDRTYAFARCVRTFVKTLPRTISNIEDVKQVVRSSGSVGANYIEANEALSKKDFLNRIRISRKESKETRYWLRLLDTHDDLAINAERDKLVQESTELMNTCGAILKKSA